ncbi:hypothetical protein C6P52_09620 [Enterococcus mundtii]|uniref:hypothetical protein n=1 Tax=Enterococcus mundtii TaxID=53346 RepID=UPI000D39CFC8|nr:hypothetical protein [Enterococcus mundtii]PTO38325.1 hypothetical protein C6P52_09620 [Enterococcus mundtii]PTO43041.1 hypothetical protein C6P54_10950 [Enterococcus mundtii]
MNPEETSGFKEQLSKKNSLSKEKPEQAERTSITTSLHANYHLEDSSMYSIESDSIYYSLDDSYSSQDHLIPRGQAKQADQVSGKQPGMMTRMWRNLLGGQFLNGTALNKVKLNKTIPLNNVQQFSKEGFGGGKLAQDSVEQSKKTDNSVTTSPQSTSKRRRILSYIAEKIQKIDRTTKRKEPRTAEDHSLPKPKTIQKNEKQSTKRLNDLPTYFTRKIRSANEAAKTANNLFSKKEKAMVAKERG